MEYRVIWEIDIKADSAEGAAREALKIQRDPDSIATVFDVTSEDGETRRVDLTEIEESRDVCEACGTPFSLESLDGGRCLAVDDDGYPCLTMICSLPPKKKEKED